MTTTREQVELILILLADYEARARRLERRLPGDPEVVALVADIATLRDTAIERLQCFAADGPGARHTHPAPSSITKSFAYG
jgi:hypothetical protein